MKKKIFSAALLFAFSLAATSTFVSCKDYDDDINELRTEITTNATKLESMVNEKVQNLNTEITALKSQQASLETALATAQTNLEKAIAKAETDANAYTDVQAAAAQKAAIESAQASLDAAVKTLQASIDAANESISNLDSKYEEKVNQLLNADAELEKAITLANSAIEAAQSTANSALAQANENKATLAELVSNLTTVKEGLEKQISVLSDDLKAANQAIADNKASVDAELAKVNSAIKSNADLIAALQGADKEILAKVEKNTTDLTALADKLAKLEEKVDANLKAANAYTDAEIATLKASLGADIDKVKADVVAATERITAAESQIENINKFIEEQKTVNTGVSESISNLNASLDEISKKVDANMETLQAAVAAVADRVSKLESAVATNTEDIKTVKALANDNASAIAENAKNIEANKKALDSLLSDFAAYKTSNESALAELQAKLNSKVDTAVSDLKSELLSELAGAVESLETKIESLDTRLSALETQVGLLQGDTGTINTIQKQIDDNNSKIQELIEALQSAFGEDGIAVASSITTTIDNVKAKIADRLSGIDNEINEIYKELAANNASIGQAINTFNDEILRVTGMSKRLTSLVFAPTKYVDGIECIMFQSATYRNWGTDASKWLADAAAATNKEITIDDAEQQVEYLANPTNVIKEDIVSLDFISNTATNTRVSASAPVKVASWELNSSNGVMTLNLTKNGTGLLGDSRDKFTIVSLKATLSDKWLTDEEKESGATNPVVYSDWARLYEVTGTPYIHNALNIDKAGKHIENATDSHFWSFSEAYPSGNVKGEHGSEYNSKHIALSVYYKNSLDLDSLTEVCLDKTTAPLDEAKYGFEFEYHLVNYILDNENATVDATDQIHFAKLSGDRGNIITSQSRDGQANNRDAIGRQPMVQVVLKNPANDAVVDVRYFKIKWVDKTDITTIENPVIDESTAYKCGSDVSFKVLEEKMNTIYAKFDLSRDEFHNTYKLCNYLYADAKTAAKESSYSASTGLFSGYSTALGTIRDLADDAEAGQTHNLVWTFNTTQQKASQADYEAEKKVVEGWAVYVSKVNALNRIIFPVKATLNISKMTLASGVSHDGTMWKDGVRVVNPQVETDAVYGTGAGYKTTQLFGNILQGYINNGKTPGSVGALVSDNVDDANFVFDEDKLSTLPKNNSSDKWTVSSDGKTLLYNGVTAATIDEDIRLYEGTNPGKDGAEPTEGALLLVGQDVPVKLAVEGCDLEDVMESYSFRIMTPLKFNETEKSVTLTDIYAGGSKSVSFARSFAIYEDAVTNHRLVWQNGGDSNPALMAWYGLEEPVYDIANATANISKDGKVNSGAWSKLSELLNQDGTKKYIVSIASNTVTFENKSGNAIGTAFQIRVPVKAKSKWQAKQIATLIVNINPGTSVK